jgi:hypothetical protein
VVRFRGISGENAQFLGLLDTATVMQLKFSR